MATSITEEGNIGAACGSFMWHSWWPGDAFVPSFLPLFLPSFVHLFVHSFSACLRSISYVSFLRRVLKMG